MRIFRRRQVGIRSRGSVVQGARKSCACFDLGRLQALRQQGFDFYEG
jgi:hypothetical protein